MASTVSGRPQQADLISKDQSEQTLELVTELAELGGKHVVSAVAQMPNLDPEKKTQFESVGLTRVTLEETARLNSLLKEVGELGADGSSSLAKNAEALARSAGLSGKKAKQIANFAKLVPLLGDLVDLGGESSSGGKTGGGLEILESIGLDLETGLAFLEENNLDLNDGLRLLEELSGNDGGASLQSLTSISHILGVGSISLGTSEGAFSFDVVETPELQAQLEETKVLLTEIAGLGATYVVGALAELPGIAEERRAQYKTVGIIGQEEKARLDSLLVELGELGSEASTAAAKAGANVPSLAKLAKLVPILTNLAELASVSDEEQAAANLAATKAVFRLPSNEDTKAPEESTVITPELTGQTEKAIKLVTELAEVGTKYVVSAVVDLADINPERRALFEGIGLVGITEEEKKSLNSLLQELGELGSESSISVAEASAGLATEAGLGDEKAAQIAKFGKLVPILQGLVDLAMDTEVPQTAPSDEGTSKVLDTIDGLDLATGADFLKKVNLNITNAVESLESPELTSKLDKTKKLLTELAELGALFAVSAVAELETISPEKKRDYEKAGTFGEEKKARASSILIELGQLGSDVSVALTSLGAGVPGFGKLAKLVPVVTTLAEIALASDSD